MFPSNILSAALITASLALSVDAAAIRERATECTWKPINPKPQFLQCGTQGALEKPDTIIKFPSQGDWTVCREACYQNKKCISYAHNTKTNTCVLFRRTILSSSPIWFQSGVSFWNHDCYSKHCVTAPATTKKATTTKKTSTTKKATTTTKKTSTTTKKPTITSKAVTTTKPASTTRTSSSTTATASPALADGSFEQPVSGANTASRWTPKSGSNVTRDTGDDAQSGDAFL